MVKKNLNFYNYIVKNNSYIYLIIFLLIIIILFLFTYYNNFFKENFEVPKKYYRCDTRKLGRINKEIFDSLNIEKDNNSWDIYIPCGYNNIERELLSIHIKDNINKNYKFIFGINGCDNIVSKNKIWESLVSCFGRKDASTYMPESYVLHKSDDMNKFRINYNPKNIYILKKNVQRKEGLKLTSDLQVILNSVLDNYRVVQMYLTNLYLINKRKVNLRIYLLIIIKNQEKKFYVSNLGKCIYTNKEYSNNNFDFESNITSYNLDMEIYKKNPRNFEELFKYIDDNSNYNNNYNSKKLSDNIFNLMKNISKCLSNSVYQSKNLKNTTCFQIFGADVIFDNNLNPYLLELNKGPDMIPRDEQDKLMKKRVQEDMFKTVGIIQQDNKENVFFEIYKD